jgi:hypothetical protein
LAFQGLNVITLNEISIEEGFIGKGISRQVVNHLPEPKLQVYQKTNKPAISKVNVQ